MWLPTTDDEREPPPTYTVRWLRPHYATVLLDLPTAPVAKGSGNHWHSFTEEESAACEAAWLELPEECRLDSGETEENNVATDPMEEEEDDVVGVAIYKDRLYEVDVRVMHVCHFQDCLPVLGLTSWQAEACLLATNGQADPCHARALDVRPSSCATLLHPHLLTRYRHGQYQNR